MLRRFGFTLVEVLISVVLLGIVGLASARILRVLLRTTSTQMAVASSQGIMRLGALALPQEFREIGYDTIPSAGAVSSDLEAIAPRRVTFRAMRGTGFTCGAPTLGELRIRKPVLGARPPALSDGFLLFVESDPNYRLDDQWVAMSVVGIDPASSCGADSAIALTLGATPVLDPGAGTAMALSQLFVGGPIRWYERVEYGALIDPDDGLAYVGVRSLSRGETQLRPIIGPLADTSGFNLTYYAADGMVLDPGLAPPTAVRSVGIDIGRITSRLGGRSGARGLAVSTRVALRNALRP